MIKASSKPANLQTITDVENSKHYQLIETAIHYLAERHLEQPSLTQLAQYIGLSETYLQRVFTLWVGISPKRFLQFLSKEYIKTLLDDANNTLEASYQAGLSSGSRIHELFITTEAMSPAQYKSMGKNLTIYYAFHHSPFGEYLLAITAKGICHLNFLQNDKASIEANFKADWSQANIEFMPERTLPVHLQIFSEQSHCPKENHLTLILKGTNFQIQVWQALLRIPFGAVTHYEGLAALINKPSAARATASAIAKNRIGYFIPCHRVVRKIGESGEYRWGKQRKSLMLAYEGAVIDSQ